MRSFGLGLAGAAIVLAIAAPAQADAGKEAFGTATFTDGSTMNVLMRYERELSHGELWTFDFNIVGMSECQALGTLGDGFVSASNCAMPFTLGGTHDTQPAPDLRLGQYKVPFSFGTKSGYLAETIAPDPGL